MDYTKATNQQLKVIIEEDREIPSLLLLEAIEEAIRRDLYHSYIYSAVNRFFKSVHVAEMITGTSYEDIKQLCYIEMYQAAKGYKHGETGFISFWYRFIRTKLINISRRGKAEKREVNRMKADLTNRDTKEEYIQIVSDTNVEKTVINHVYLDYLFQFVKPGQLEVLELMRKGYRIIDVAEILGISRKVIDKRFRDAQKRIMGGLGDGFKTVI